MIRHLILAFAALLVLAGTGCESIDLTWEEVLSGKMQDKKKEVKYVLTVHKFVKYPRANNLEQEITTFDGRKLWINTNFFIHSNHIMDVKLIPRDGKKDFYDLELKLDRKGAMKWLQMTLHFRGQPMAVLIDGMYYRTFVPEKLTTEDDEWVLLEGPFDAVTAKGIKKYAKINYNIFNPDPNALF
jgi:hypothetical protein